MVKYFEQKKDKNRYPEVVRKCYLSKNSSVLCVRGSVPNYIKIVLTLNDNFIQNIDSNSQ